MLFDSSIKLLIMYNSNKKYYYFMRKLSKISGKWYRILRNIKHLNTTYTGCDCYVAKNVNKFFRKMCSIKLNISSEKFLDIKLKSNIRYLEINNYSNCTIKIKNKTFRNCENLYSLKLSGIEFNKKVLNYLPIQNLRELHLSDVSLIVDNFFEYFKNLHTLKISRCDDLNENTFKYIGRLKNLHTLAFNNFYYTYSMNENSYKHLKNLKNLKKLDLSNNIEAFENSIFKYLENIEILNLFNCDRITDKNFSYLKNLKELNIVDCHDINSIKRILKRCPTLRVLYTCSSSNDLYDKNLFDNSYKYINDVNIHIKKCFAFAFKI